MTTDMLVLPAEAAQLAPHRPPMLLLSRLLACDGEQGLAEAVVPEHGPVLDAQGRLLPEALWEMVAQAYALVAGYAARRQDPQAPPRQGMLVGMRHAQVLSLARAGEVLQVHVEPGGHFGDFVMVQGQVMRDGEVLGQAELKLYMAEDAPPPLPRA